MTPARVMRWASLLSAVAIASAWRPLSVPTATEIVQSMHDKYAGKWFKTLTFVQKTTRQTKAGKDTVQTWYESASLPGRLRIDVGKPSEGNGVLYTHDSTYQMASGSLKQSVAGGNPLIPLLFDVYVVPVDRTIADVRNTLKIDLSKVSQSTWDGRPVYIVGANAGDEHAPQVWIDTERLVVLRQIFVVGDTSKTYIDSQFKQYRQIGQSWIAPQCEFFIDGKLLQREEYTDIKADVPLSESLFDPAQWKTAPHWLH
jgi:outer membrane lipoprotein-sorting protein